MVGYDPESDFTISPWVDYFLRQGQGDDELVVGALVKFYPGQKVSLFGRLLSVTATLDRTGIGYFDRSAFIPIAGARKLIRSLMEAEAKKHLHKRRNIDDLSLDHLYAPSKVQEKEMKKMDPGAVSAIFIKAKDGVKVKELGARITKALPATAVINVRAAAVSVKRRLTSMLDALFPPIIILMLMGMAILAVVFSMSANERKREVGLLRALGARRLDVFNLFLGESVLIAIMGGIFGVLGGGALIILFKHRIMAALDLLYIWPSAGTVAEVILLTLAASVVIGVGAGLVPALRAARMDPYEAFRAG
jgi:putative ABC transport system permease protein